MKILNILYKTTSICCKVYVTLTTRTVQIGELTVHATIATNKNPSITVHTSNDKNINITIFEKSTKKLACWIL